MKTSPADLCLFYLQRAPVPLPGTPVTQTYFPSLEVLFPSQAKQSSGSPMLAASELVVAIDASTGVATVEHLLEKRQRQTPIWIRAAHLLEPLDVMEKLYILPQDGALPSFREAWQRTLRKLNDPYNEAYTDAIMACMASRLVETGRSPHFCRFYGTFNGRTPVYKYMITDDMPTIEGEQWFREGLQRGEFKVVAVDPYNPEVSGELSHPWEDIRGRLRTDDVVSVLESDSEDSSMSATDTDGDSATSAGTLEEVDLEVSGEATVNRPRIRLNRLTGSQGSSSGSGSTEDDLEFFAHIPNFPVQLTVLERCDGTMDDLMEDEIADDVTEAMRETKEARWTAWIFQVIAGLATAQQAYDFVHNDLHTNNVMWCGTGETHLYYHVQGAPGGDRFYRVPTYGRIMKIIDFGRATFRPPSAATGNRLWIPDAYGPDADAEGQYNCGIYYRQGEPKVQPNKSFDLCRLAVAILETLWPEKPEPTPIRKVLTREPGRTQHETVSPLWNLMWLWLTDKEGRNLLLTPSDEQRYQNFEIYCAIARASQNAIPAQQLTLPLFDSAFRCRRRDIPADATIWKVHAAPKH